MKNLISLERIIIAFIPAFSAAFIFWGEYSHVDLTSYFTFERLFPSFTMAICGIYSFLYIYDNKSIIKSKGITFNLLYWVLLLGILTISVYGIITIPLLLLNLESKLLL